MDLVRTEQNLYEVCRRPCLFMMLVDYTTNHHHLLFVSKCFGPWDLYPISTNYVFLVLYYYWLHVPFQR
uniref:Uncharacterized protein n=1 Tax=Arundo donax TaxID=35708 RepID=A0A0A9B6I5_ARUDO